MRKTRSFVQTAKMSWNAPSVSRKFQCICIHTHSTQRSMLKSLKCHWGFELVRHRAAISCSPRTSVAHQKPEWIHFEIATLVSRHSSQQMYIPKSHFTHDSVSPSDLQVVFNRVALRAQDAISVAMATAGCGVAAPGGGHKRLGEHAP